MIKEVQKGAEEMNKYKDLHIMLTMGPMARRKDCNFPTQDASCLTGKLFDPSQSK